jgi:biopolymer transport protein ExbB/TolQ
MKCKAFKNPGFEWIMILMLLVGYIMFFVYLVVILLVVALYSRRFFDKRARQSQSRQILKSISRIRFSEELFGALEDENECIICMSQYTSSSLITKLDCSGNHFYHTECIEGWIK